eukprot:6881987-Prymnesium_polylepis.2
MAAQCMAESGHQPGIYCNQSTTMVPPRFQTWGAASKSLGIAELLWALPEWAWQSKGSIRVLRSFFACDEGVRPKAIVGMRGHGENGGGKQIR